jgi:3-oxoacyl-[acyl-carrier-protein] synthase-3
MRMETGCEILGLGHYAPEHRVSNAELEARLDLESGWIERRSGIRERRFASADQALTDIALPAAEMALEQAGLKRCDIALLLLATSTPDHLLPPSGPLLAHRLGLAQAGAADLAGACAGFVYALTLADGFVRRHHAPVLIVAANILSRRTDFTDRDSAILFADAAGAMVLAPTMRSDAGVLGASLVSAGDGYDLIAIPAGGSRKPFSADLAPEETLMRITDGRAVFARAIAMMTDPSRAALEQAQTQGAHVDHWVPHQANTRIIEQVRHRLGIAPENTLMSLADYGNSSAATIPFTLSLRASERGYAPGQRLLFSAVGAGLTGGAVVFGW